MAGADVATGIQRIAAAFAGHERRGALMPYLMGGFPNADDSFRIAQAYVDGGADLIEYGLPFSDPLADGPVIHAAAVDSLAAGAVIDKLLDGIAPVAAQVPVMVMTYFNIIHARGVERFLGRCADIGVSGLIVPDIPLEESAALLEPCDRHGLALIPLIAPTTPDERMGEICAQARGFIYVVSVTGTTGERTADAAGLSELVGRVRAHTDLPIAVGFGIGEPEQASRVADVADGAIVGTRLVRAVREAHEGAGDPAPAAQELVSAFSSALA
ncbi:MAG: tryptophan synthase subunit alpha [Solirubrobacterales bacterium]